MMPSVRRRDHHGRPAPFVRRGLRAPLLGAYGSTETCGSITINWPTGASQAEGSRGLPVPGLGVRLVDPETEIDVAPGEEGEVWVSGPSVMLGYHNQPEATATALKLLAGTTPAT